MSEVDYTYFPAVLFEREAPEPPPSRLDWPITFIAYALGVLLINAVLGGAIALVGITLHAILT